MTNLQAKAEFERCYDRHVRAVDGYVRGMCGHHDYDIVSDVFVDAWRQHPGIDADDSSTRDVLLRIAHRHVTDRPAITGDSPNGVYGALAKLPEPTRHALLAAFHGSGSRQELAASHGVSDAALIRQLERGLRGLRWVDRLDDSPAQL